MCRIMLIKRGNTQRNRKTCFPLPRSSQLYQGLKSFTQMEHLKKKTEIYESNIQVPSGVIHPVRLERPEGKRFLFTKCFRNLRGASIHAQSSGIQITCLGLWTLSQACHYLTLPPLANYFASHCFPAKWEQQLSPILQGW